MELVTHFVTFEHIAHRRTIPGVNPSTPRIGQARSIDVVRRRITLLHLPDVAALGFPLLLMDGPA
jgi:hypothetical protein